MFIILLSPQSLDYDIPDSDLLLDEELSNGMKYETKKNISRWIIFMLIGVITAGIGIFLDIAIDKLSEIKYGTLKHCILSYSYHHHHNSPRFTAFYCTKMCL